MRILVATLLATLAVPRPLLPVVGACAAVSGEGTSVLIASESALIIWDEKAKTQHFIRRASFATKEPYFGFLVPTPTVPDLAEVPDELFQQLEDWTKAEVRTRREYRSPFTMSARLDKAGGVEVLGRQRVGGFDATKLRASDPTDLKDWLEKHGYVTRPGLTAWLEPYVKAKWIITAFQIAKSDVGQPMVSTRAVQMSFNTDRPFFPYSEPGEQKGKVSPRRLLRVFFVSTERMQGKLEKGGTWPGEAVWANELTTEQQRELKKHLAKTGIRLPSPAWLTVFDDRISPRHGKSDLFFSRSSDQSSMHRPLIERTEVIIIPIWLYVLPLIGSALLLLVIAEILTRRARAHPSSGPPVSGPSS